MEITYIKKGEEETLKGWKAKLFLFTHIDSWSHGNIVYYFQDIEFLHIKGANFKTKRDFIFSSNGCKANLILEDCEFSCSSVEISDQDIVQMIKNTFENDSKVSFSGVCEIELDLIQAKKKLDYYVGNNEKLTVKGNGLNTSMKAYSTKALFSHVSDLFIDNCYFFDLEILSSEVNFKRCGCHRACMKESEVYGTNLRFPTLTLQNSKIESDESLDVNGTTYFSKEKDGKVVLSNAILEESSHMQNFYPNSLENTKKEIPVCRINNDIKLENIVSLLSTFKALGKRCNIEQVAIAEEISRKDMNLKILSHEKNIDEYKKQIEEEEKQIQLEEQRIEKMKENVQVCFEQTPIKKILK